MSQKAVITVHRSREEVERLWGGAEHPTADEGAVTFKDAPGDRGTEIHVALEPSGAAAKLPDVVGKLAGAAPRAKAKDELRRFKALVETGEVPRSDGVPEGEHAERKFKQRPAQPLSESELDKAGI